MTYETYHKIIRRIGVIALILGVFVAGAFLGTTKSVAKILTPKTAELASIPNTDLNNTDLSEFWYVWNLMDKKYPFTDKAPTNQEKIYGAISGLVNSYNDPYTVYFPPQEAKLFREQVKGSFGGVGMEVGLKDGYITVVAPIKDSPAEKAGLKAGDIITEINGEKTDNLTLDTAISKIRGEIGTMVDLGIARKGAGEIQHFKVIRDVVKLPVINTEEKGDIFIISLYNFSENSAQLFTDALQEFTDSGKQKLIIDVRNNPGGYLEASVDIASYFLPIGKTIVRENSGEDTPEIIHQSKGYTMLRGKNPKIVMLINGGSASASEIVAGALSEQAGIKLVGTKSFGKGSVQELINLEDKSSIKITVAKWLTPKGHSISEKGITPDVIVEDKPVKNSAGEYNDPQMEAAIKLLTK